MSTRAKLSVRCASTLVGGALRSVLTPDNEGVPRGLRFSMRGSAKDLEFSISSESAPTAVSTCLALLRDIALFEQIWLLSRPGNG